MKKEIKTMKINELIQELQDWKKEFGDIPVIHQSDPEGNSFGTIDKRSFSYDSDTTIGTALFICPFEEDIEDELYPVIAY